MPSCAVVIAVVIADSLWFAAGRLYGRRFLTSLVRFSLSLDTTLRTARSWFERFGVPLLALSKFVPGLGLVSSPLLGTTQIDVRVFVFWDLVGAALWARRGRGSAAGGLWLTSSWVALAFGLAIGAGLGFADDAGLPDVALLVIHLAAAALALLLLRAGLHHVLLHEQRDARIGPPRVCPHCFRVVPAMPFCPMCGVAEQATTLNPLPLVRTRKAGRGPAGPSRGRATAASGTRQ